jgi:(S)-ureidoglycine aminohydrolase
MHQLGSTRSSHQQNHLLHAPDAFVRAPLPGMKKATAVVHAAPAVGAAFTQYTAEFESGGCLGPASTQRFVYVLAGKLKVLGKTLGPDEYAYLPVGEEPVVAAAKNSKASVIEKPREPLGGDGAAPRAFTGSEKDIAPQPLMGDPWVEVRTLIPPSDLNFDFAVNTMTFQPGGTLPMVEVHVMEHGLLMLAGGGIYRLGDHWYPAQAGDFIWMAPYCPQWFGALGKAPSKYLIYKDWNRHPL